MNRSTTTTTKREEQTQTTLPTFRKRYINDREVEALYGISRRKLKSMRLLNRGPLFRRFGGNRLVMYEVSALERWIESLPSGGGNY